MSTTRQAVMQLLASLAKHADPETARLLKQSKAIHTLATNCSTHEGFKRGKFYGAARAAS